MVSAQKREKLSTLLHSLETEDRKWLQQKLMRQDTASLLRDEKGLSDQELLAAESWYWQQYAESTSMRARRAWNWGTWTGAPGSSTSRGNMPGRSPCPPPIAAACAR